MGNEKFRRHQAAMMESGASVRLGNSMGIALIDRLITSLVTGDGRGHQKFFRESIADVFHEWQ